MGKMSKFQREELARLRQVALLCSLDYLDKLEPKRYHNRYQIAQGAVNLQKVAPREVPSILTKLVDAQIVEQLPVVEGVFHYRINNQKREQLQEIFDAFEIAEKANWSIKLDNFWQHGNQSYRDWREYLHLQENGGLFA